jgi:hypothetical protein
MIIQGIKLTGTTIITPGPPTPVLYYDPSNISSYSGSGTDINDLSGNGLTGTMSNITYTSPYFSYNGTSSRITIPDNALLEPGTGDWTMEAWVYNTLVSATQVGPFVISKGSGLYGIRHYVGPSFSNQLASNLSGSNAEGSSSIQVGPSSATVMLPNTWTHVVSVYKTVSTKTLEIFINGISKDSESHTMSSVTNNTGALYIGSTSSGSSNFWEGRIGIVRLYNAALSSEDVLANYNSSKAIYGL